MSERGSAEQVAERVLQAQSGRGTAGGSSAVAAQGRVYHLVGEHSLARLELTRAHLRTPASRSSARTTRTVICRRAAGSSTAHPSTGTSHQESHNLATKQATEAQAASVTRREPLDNQVRIGL